MGREGFEPPHPKDLVYSQARLTGYPPPTQSTLGRTRTRSRWLRRPLLFQLSYEGAHRLVVKVLLILAARAGVEPALFALTVRRPTIRLPGIKAGRAGIEPTSLVLETNVLATELPTHKLKKRGGFCITPALCGLPKILCELRGWTPTSRRELQIGRTQVKSDQARRIGPLI
jgi:hypothetical protein